MRNLRQREINDLPQLTQLVRGRADIELKQVNSNASSLSFSSPTDSQDLTHQTRK